MLALLGHGYSLAKLVDEIGLEAASALRTARRVARRAFPKARVLRRILVADTLRMRFVVARHHALRSRARARSSGMASSFPQRVNRIRDIDPPYADPTGRECFGMKGP